MKKEVMVWLCAVLCLFLGSPVMALDSQEKPVEKLDDVVVTETRPEETPEHVQDVIAQQAMEAPSISGSVLDALEDSAGVQIRRSALAGNNAGSLRIRGFGETRLRILADGVSIQRDGSYGSDQVDWGTLSPESVERIEIHRGAGPAKFGNTLGGVVNIVSKDPTEAAKTTVTASAGSLGTWDNRLAHSAKAGPVGWSISASHFETDGYLRNNFADRKNVSGRMTLDLPHRFQVGAGFAYSDLDTGFAVYNRPDSIYFDSGEPTADEKAIGGPGIGSRLLGGVSAWGDNSHAEDQNTALTAFVAKDYGAGRAKIDFRLWNQERTEYYFDAATPGKKIYQRTTDAEDNNWAIQAEATYRLGDHQLEAGGEMRRYGWGDQAVDYIDKTYFNGSINFMKFVSDGFKGQPECLTYQALYLQDRWRLNDRMDLEMGLRGERFEADSIDPAAFGFTWPATVTSMEEESLDPRLAVIFRPWETATMEARFGVTHRFPNSPEYFWWYLNKGTNFFNTDFQPEKALQYELSYAQRIFRRLKTTVRGYYYDIENYISSTTVPGVGSVYFNIDEVDIHGIEFSAEAAVSENLRVWGNATWQQGDKDGDPWDANNELTGELPDLPEFMFNLGLDWTPLPALSTKISMNHVGERDQISGATLETHGAYTRVNVSGSYLFWENTWSQWKAMLSCENLLDEEYEEEDGYPMPGATFMAGLNVTF